MATCKAYSYLRFSTLDQMEGDSFRRQTALAQEYAQRKGLDLDDKLTFHDLGVSAFRGKNAEAGRLSDFLEAVKAGLVQRGSFLLVENLDRISRQAARKALRVLEAICEEGITVVTLTDGREYTQEALDTDPMALIMSILTFIRANEESAMKSKRVKAAWAGKREKARADRAPVTANGPWWLTLDAATGKWKVDRERAEVIRWCAQRLLKGSTVLGLAKELTEKAVPSPRNSRRWYTATLRRILTSPALIGTYSPATIEWQGRVKRYKSLEPIADYYPPVVSQELYGQLQAILKPSRRTRGGIPSDGNLFRGLAICANCGAPMRWIRRVSKPAKQARPDPTIYVCAAGRDSLGICKWRSVHADRLEEAFMREASHILGSIPAGTEDLDAQIEQARANLEALEDAKERNQVAYEKTGKESFMERLVELAVALDEAQEALEKLEEKQRIQSGPLVKHRVRELQRVIRGEPMDRAAANVALRQVFTEIAVDAEQGSAEFVWRHGGSHTVGFPVVKRGRPQR